MTAAMPDLGRASTNRVHESGFRDTPKGHKTPYQDIFMPTLRLSISLFHKFRTHKSPASAHTRGASLYVLSMF